MKIPFLFFRKKSKIFLQKPEIKKIVKKILTHDEVYALSQYIQQLEAENFSLKEQNNKIKSDVYQPILQEWNMNKNEFEEKVLDLLNYDLQKKASDEFEKNKKMIEDEKDEHLKRILLDSMDNLTIKFEFPRKINRFNLKDNDADKMIPKILGKNGRNKLVFEKVTKTKIEKVKDCNTFTITAFNNLDALKAYRLMDMMCQKGYVDEKSIRSQYKMIVDQFDEEVFQIGKKILIEEIEYPNFSKNLAIKVGLLNHRFSNDQNVLEHSIECAILAQNIAKELKLDPIKAKYAGFFHDIGKADDFLKGNNYNHAKRGVEIAKEEKMPEYLINAIEAHHGYVAAKTPYAQITKAVDRISASRKGARSDFYEKIMIKYSDNIYNKIIKLEWVDELTIQNHGCDFIIKIHDDRFDFRRIELHKNEIIKIIKNVQEETNQKNNRTINVNFISDFDYQFKHNF